MLSRFVERFETDENIAGVFLGRHEQPQSKKKKKGQQRGGGGYSYLGFKVPTEAFAAHALSAALAPPPREHRLRSALYPAAEEQGKEGAKPGHVVVEFSSPNVAKPFHVGHLRKPSLFVTSYSQSSKVLGVSV